MVVENQIATIQVFHEEVMKISEVLKSLANPKRLNILMFLNSGTTQSFKDLKDFTQISKTSLVNHLVILEKEHLIDRLSRGLYKITHKGRTFLDTNVNLFEVSSNIEYFDENQSFSPYQGIFAPPIEYRDSYKLQYPAKYEDAMNSFTSSVAGILHSFNKNWDLIDVTGFSGMCFANYFTKDEIDGGSPYKYLNWCKVLQGIDKLGYKTEMIYQDYSFPTYYGTLTIQDIDRAKGFFEIIKEKITAYNTPAILYGISLPEYGIVNGYFQDYYLVHAHHQGMEYSDFPLQFYSLRANNFMQAIFFSDPTPELTDEDYRLILSNAIFGANGLMCSENEEEKDFCIGGPDIFKEWGQLLESNIEVLDQNKLEANGYLGRYYLEARRHAMTFLKRLATKFSLKSFSFLLQKAAEEYEKIVQLFEEFSTLFPYIFGEKMNFSYLKEGTEILFAIAHLEKRAIQFMTDAINMWH